ncbi:MAG: 2-isopropylmalate synthase [Deltaproteobacteria bacterium]|nr:2-isopropylmalate synthase [Deltaproteobacteria bacterium]
MTWSWNSRPRASVRPTLQDETLRDGIQSASAFDPAIGEKIELLHSMDGLGIGVVNVGLPAASARNRADSEALCDEIVRSKLRIRPAAAGRTVVSDLVPIVELSQRAGVPVAIYTFIGSSAIRALAEDWSVERIVRQSAEAIRFGVREGLEVCYVTEDTSRARPEVLATLYENALACGAKRLCVADTVGSATPDGVRALVGFTRSIIAANGYSDIGIDWHGHNDRGLVLMNALAALDAGADRLHACALGIGERSGNAPMELLLLNLDLADEIPVDRARLADYCALAARALHWTVPPNHPLIGGRSPGPLSRPATADAATTSGLAR